MRISLRLRSDDHVDKIYENARCQTFPMSARESGFDTMNRARGGGPTRKDTVSRGKLIYPLVIS
jgi:hypothetical protein